MSKNSKTLKPEKVTIISYLLDTNVFEHNGEIQVMPVNDLTTKAVKAGELARKYNTAGNYVMAAAAYASMVQAAHAAFNAKDTARMTKAEKTQAQATVALELARELGKEDEFLTHVYNRENNAVLFAGSVRAIARRLDEEIK